MQSRSVDVEGRRVVIVVADKGDDAVAAITDASAQHGLQAAQITGVGGFSRATLGYFDRDRSDYTPIPVDEQVEVLSFLGDLATAKGKRVPHVHVVLGRSDGTTVGGHLQHAEVWPTLEVVLSEVGPQLAKRLDPQTGLALIDLSQVAG
jgi:predicted DNA-binding protein with PD1-like motif